MVEAVVEVTVGGVPDIQHIGVRLLSKRVCQESLVSDYNLFPRIFAVVATVKTIIALGQRGEGSWGEGGTSNSGLSSPVQSG